MQESIEQKMYKSIARWQQSKLTQRAWCQKNKIAYGTFHYWYKKFRSQDLANAQPASFVQLTVDDPAPADSWCELVLPDGKKLVFHRPVPAEFLKMLAG